MPNQVQATFFNKISVFFKFWSSSKFIAWTNLHYIGPFLPYDIARSLLFCCWRHWGLNQPLAGHLNMPIWQFTSRLKPSKENRKPVNHWFFVDLRPATNVTPYHTSTNNDIYDHILVKKKEEWRPLSILLFVSFSDTSIKKSIDQLHIRYKKTNTFFHDLVIISAIETCPSLCYCLESS